MLQSTQTMGWMVIPAVSRQERAVYRAADEAAYNAGWKTHASRFVADKQQAEQLAAKISAMTGHLFTTTECLY